MLNKQQLLNILALSKDATAIYATEDIVIQMANDAMISFWGKDRSIMGRPLAEAVPELKEQPFIDLLKNVWTSGETYEAINTPAQLLINGKLVTLYFDFIYRAIKNEDGTPYCILHTATDVTEKLQNIKALQESENEKASLHENVRNTNVELQKTNAALHESNKAVHISEQNYREVSAALLQSRNELQFAVDAAGMATFDFDPHTKSFKGNATIKKWFRLPTGGEIALTDAINAIIPEDRERVSLAIENAMAFSSGGQYDIVYGIANLGAEPRVVHAKGKVLFNDVGVPIRLSGIVQDITEQAKDEQRKNTFISMVSHELKTPLTAISGFIQVLKLGKENSADPIQKKLLERATVQVNKMIGMVNGFLDIARIDSGKIPVALQRVDLCLLMEDAAEEARVTITTHPVSVSHCEPVFINADADKINTVISNFIDNAGKYSPHGAAISISCTPANNMVTVGVHDKGPGIPEEELDKLFRRYYRVENNYMDSVSGFGIGLYLSAEIIKEHGGTTWAESTIGKGSSFYFKLPVA